MLSVINIIPIAIDQVIHQIAIKLQAVFQITHLQNKHKGAILNIGIGHTLRIICIK